MIIFFSFLPLMLLRPLLYRRFISNAEMMTQPRRAFILDFFLCFAAGIIINIYELTVFGIPVVNLLSPLIGCIIAGFFIGLDSALRQERLAIVHASGKNSTSSLPKRFFPMTRKFTLVAITASVFVSLVLIMVFTRDVEWLVTTSYSEEALHAGQMSVIYEVLFIMSVLMILIVNLIFSFSRNLKLLFNNETKVLEEVQNGNLTNKVPVATSDEFGVIAGHTNHMIDGLRHRFELISALKLAEEVQQNLLPERSPSFEKFDISGTSIYCEQTGGDYYDYFLLPGNKLGIAVADACGHGVGAALLMSSVRAFITSAVSTYQNPGQLLNSINRYITEDCAKTSRFTSMFFLELDTENGSLRWVRAGHEPALLFSQQQQRTIELRGEGLVLGIDKNFHFETHGSVSMQPGDLLLIGTDGIKECLGENGAFFGNHTLERLLSQNRELTAHEIQEKIVSAVEAFRGNQPQEDDITLVIIKAF